MFKCNKCFKQFSSLSSLNFHINYSKTCSNNSQRFKCDYCDKTFNRQSSMIRHIETVCKKQNDTNNILEKIKILEEKITLLEKNNNTTNNTNCHNTYYIQNNITSEDIINAAKKLTPDKVAKPKDILGHFWKSLNLEDKININEKGEAYYYFNGKLITESQDFKFIISQIAYYSKDDMVILLKDSIFEDLDNIRSYSDEKFSDIQTKKDLTMQNLELIRDNIDTSDPNGNSYKNTLIRCISMENKEYEILENELVNCKNTCFETFHIQIK